MPTLLLTWLLLSAVLAQSAPMVLRSPAFKHNDVLPLAYTGYGDFTSPPLSWSGAPEGTREFVLTLEDPDVPLERFSVHWLLYDIPATVTALPATSPFAKASTSAEATADRTGDKAADRSTRDHPSPLKGASQGLNALKRIGFLPPRPFAGSGAHHYTFTLYAIDVDLTLPAGASKEQLLAAIRGHVLAEARLVATFEHKE
jgi:Raf kinase inhibitor-like YbhB/YbcL family protein